MHEQSNSFLVTQPIGSLMRRYAIPCIISLLVAALYNIVDQIFIANASYLGSYGNAANTVVFPLTVVALAIAVMIGDGCCAFVSISLGSGQTDRARKSIGSAILLSVLLGILLTTCYLLFSQQILTALLSVRYLCRMKAVRLDRSCFRLHGDLAKRYLPLGICSFLSQISLVAAMAAIQNMTLKYGALDPIFSQSQYAQIPLAVLGIVMKFFQIVISVAVGMAAGCIPIIGYNLGAERRDRAAGLLTRLILAEAAVGALALVIVELFPGQLIGLFGAANESTYYTQFAIRCFRVYLCMMVLATVNKAAFIYLQALGKSFLSTALSMIREVVFGVGLSLLLPRFFGLDGVLYSMPVSDVLTFLISAVVLVRTYRALRQGGDGASFSAL